MLENISHHSVISLANQFVSYYSSTFVMAYTFDQKAIGEQGSKGEKRWGRWEKERKF